MFLAELRGNQGIGPGAISSVSDTQVENGQGSLQYFGHPPQKLGPPHNSSTSSSSSAMQPYGEAGPSSAPSGSHFPPGVSSPPPTSTSFSSFRTFGVGNDDEKTFVRSYGFSGAGSMRDDSYLRKVQKGARSRDLNESTFKANTEPGVDVDGSPRRQVPLPAAISPKRANASWAADRLVIGTGNTIGSDWTEQFATPTSLAALPTPGALHLDEGDGRPNAGPSRSDTSPLEPEDPAQSSPLSVRQNRQSFLHALTPSQVRRISMALMEVDNRLRPHREGLAQMSEDGEEILVPTESRIESSKTGASRHARHESSSSVRSQASQSSALPPSPRTHDLAAQISSKDVAPIVPRPVLTPVRTLPVRHTPSLSTDSGDRPSPAIPLYVPGQPRPVRHMHRSEGSMSIGYETPTLTSSIQNSPMLSDVSSDQGRATSDSTPTQPANPYIKARTSSLARSTQSPHTATVSSSTDSSKSFSDVNTPNNPRFRTVAVPRGSSPFEMMVRTPSESILEEADEGKEDGLSLDESRRSSMSSGIPQVKSIPNRHIVSESQRASNDMLRSSLSHDDLAPQMMANGNAWSHEGIIEYSSSGTVSRAKSPTSLRRLDSSSTLSSNFFDAATADSPLDGVHFDDDSQQHPVERQPDPIDLSRLLRKLSGLGMEELVLLQGKLVEKAKLERETLRGGENVSPGLAVSSLRTDVINADASLLPFYIQYPPILQQFRIHLDPSRPCPAPEARHRPGGLPVHLRPEKLFSLLCRIPQTLSLQSFSAMFLPALKPMRQRPVWLATRTQSPDHLHSLRALELRRIKSAPYRHRDSSRGALRILSTNLSPPLCIRIQQ